MDLDILKKSILYACCVVVFSFISIQILLWLIAYCSTEFLAGIMLFILFGLLIKMDYDYRKFVNRIGK